MRNFFLLFLFALFFSCRPPQVTYSPGETALAVYHAEWEKYFDTVHVNGYFLLYSVKDTTWHHAYRNFPVLRHRPGSTFKIPNSLIALETGAVKSENDTIEWDGMKRRKEWDADTDMKNAMKNSTVWFYRELARRIGGKKMKAYLDTMSYGNADTSGGIDKFWLTGGLAISPAEQISFLQDLYYERLPFKKEHQQTVKRIIVNEENNEVKLSGKTGFTEEGNEQVGWYVGYVEKDNNVWFFANCITSRDTSNEQFVPARKDIAKKILRDLKLLE